MSRDRCYRFIILPESDKTKVYVVPDCELKDISFKSRVPLESGKYIVLSAVGSITTRLVSKASAVVPSKTIEESDKDSPDCCPVKFAPLIVGEVSVLLVSVAVLSSVTTGAAHLIPRVWAESATNT